MLKDSQCPKTVILVLFWLQIAVLLTPYFSQHLSPKIFSGHHRCPLDIVQTNIILCETIGTKTILKTEGGKANVTNPLRSGCY